MWMWDGTQWTCQPCDGTVTPAPPCPPPIPPVPGFHPWFDPQTNPWYPGANAGVSFGTIAPTFPIRGNFWWDGKRLWMFDGAAWVDIVDNAIKTGSGSGTGTGTPPPAGTGNVIISSTPPGNPALGAEWWNGSQLHVWDGNEWQVVGPGALTGPVPTTSIVFGMTCTSNRTLPGSSAWGIVPFNDLPNPDPMNGWDAVQHKYAPVKPGIYLFEIRGGGAPGSGIALLKNDPGAFANTAASDIIVAIQTQATGGWNSVSGVVLLNGTTDFVRMWAWSTDAVFHNTGSNQIFTGALLP
jgi:hypothetical protein